jgi:hypothetical protein
LGGAEPVVQPSPFRALITVLVTAACLFSFAGCAPDLPPSLPSTDAHLRSASRIELVDLVISDPARAEKVRRLYAEIEDLMVGVKKATATEIVKLGVENAGRTDEDTRAAVGKVRDADIAAFRRYVALQMELRRSMSAEEFAQLDKIK